MKNNKDENNLVKTIGTRLILGLFFISSLMVLFISGVIRTQMHRSGEMLTEATQNHLITAAQSLTNLISIEELNLFYTREDTKTDKYQELKQRLLKFSEDNNLLYAYYWRYYGNNQLQFIIDNDFDPEEEVGPWIIVNIIEDYLASPALDGNIVVSDLTTIALTWDGLITAYAPVYDSEGNIYCIAGVDISHNYLFIQRRDTWRMTLIQLIAIPLSVISGILNLILYRRRAKQIQEASVKLANEKDMIQIMKDNINQGVFLMDKEFKILPQYSQLLVSILSYHDAELTGKNFVDIINASFDTKQLQILKTYFSMIFDKAKSEKILESINPIFEFDYKINDHIKTLSTKFHLIEQENAEAVIIGIVQDITREKEFERELQAQKEIQEQGMKNMFDVFQIDPLVFQDFIEDTEANFNYINSLLKDRSLSEKQVVIKIYQSVHIIKSNAMLLGLENFGKKLHALEDVIKAISSKDIVTVDDILSLAVKIEVTMQEMDSYIAITKKISAYRTANQSNTIFINSISKAAERLAIETQKKVKIEAKEIDLAILESKLRKPIKDILYQCLRNAIYHGIEPEAERIKKGKNPQGLLVFSIKNIDGKAEIIFSDDGSGLNWEKIKKKYLEKNPGAKVDNKILLGTIFAPEFSTANETSSVAGRGVGLSLVKDLVKENKGTINVKSTETGLMFKFTFPLA